MPNQLPPTSIDPANPHGFYSGVPGAVQSAASIPLGTLQAIPHAVGSLVAPAVNGVGGMFGAAPSGGFQRGFYSRPSPASPEPPLNAPPANFIQPS